MMVKNNNLPEKVEIATWGNTLPTTTYLTDNQSFVANGFTEIPTALIARGAGRSYSDGAYLTDEITLSTKRMNLINNDNLDQGIIVCQPGVQLIALHRHLYSYNWSFPIYGGTQWATVGGGVAADMHGKNSHIQGTFGNHVHSLEIITGQGDLVFCSRETNHDLFKATIGGMGLTGFIKKMTLSLQKGVSKTVHSYTKSVSSLAEMFDYFDAIPSDFQMCSWVMCQNPASKGIHWYALYSEEKPYYPRRLIPVWVPKIRGINRFTMSVGGFIEFLAHNNLDQIESVLHFNYSAIHERVKCWNRLYGANGCIEYHFMVAKPFFEIAFNKFVGECRRRGIAMYITVIKKFEDTNPAGFLSFVEDGYTMNVLMDNTPQTRMFVTYFTDFILELKGKIYLAKDTYMSSTQFQKMYPELEAWQTIVKKYDPYNKFQSDLSRRLALKPW